ncbi:hypothetical protein F5I97DRAFT_118058 [Phlebopus sp. FC_14]|nr:hypothetical protein F5I97DRAFT_118058 [Phlebopus sp. FC_14]
MQKVKSEGNKSQPGRAKRKDVSTSKISLHRTTSGSRRLPYLEFTWTVSAHCRNSSLPANIAMDDIARPPARLQVHSSTPLSMKNAQAHVDDFLSDFRSRSTPSKGGDNTITAQLEKLGRALKEQRARERRAKMDIRYGLCILDHFMHSSFTVTDIYPVSMDARSLELLN